MNLTIVAGARPNFMKIAPLIDAIARRMESNIKFRLVHTGQHFDKNMSGDFFEQLGIPEPHINLKAGGGTQAEQTANIMVRFEKELIDNPTDLVIVVGDVTSTMACSIVSKKLNTKVAHIEAGIRSGDTSMPEEINRIVTDSISDYFFTTSEYANVNLRRIGISESRIFFVGNTMIDTLLKYIHEFKQPAIWRDANLEIRNYFVLTLHRPSNVDQCESLMELLNQIMINCHDLPVIFPLHPRTAGILESMAFKLPNLYEIDPLPYKEFNYLVQNAKAVITDSGGITEEATVMGIPCITLRDSTERPETVSIGTNLLVGKDYGSLVDALDVLFRGQWKKGGIPEFWDGKTSDRIVEHLIQLFQTESGLQRHSFLLSESQ